MLWMSDPTGGDPLRAFDDNDDLAPAATLSPSGVAARERGRARVLRTHTRRRRNRTIARGAGAASAVALLALFAVLMRPGVAPPPGGPTESPEKIAHAEPEPSRPAAQVARMSDEELLEQLAQLAGGAGAIALARADDRAVVILPANMETPWRNPSELDPGDAEPDSDL